MCTYIQHVHVLTVADQSSTPYSGIRDDSDCTRTSTFTRREFQLTSNHCFICFGVASRILARSISILPTFQIRYTCIRLSVTFVRPTTEIFGNVSTPSGTLAIRDLSVKILRTSSQGNPSVWGVKHKSGSQI